ncbi:hypothetical protein PF005_g24880 [Phytophthora fragariae]|uniref:Uncharacterized protein n=3 Tax=Phytophthora fragariae TaxID=53985 RepID=A0A6A3DUY9_9STRA|nr:hypothetical protein PF009_g24140 [Phytophthora fragariae]KAE8971627.1 hypothetical protein PF011_g25965 [Phytophthora fragariae]KAE9079521.1 hypothetical protein PF010_g22728 [Phytophthora fragariae]KAE9101350.1 hypothetical protein PF006_g22693 [Phytophthora fragariae]KAE9176566.1 hypothetical protein PF005_g24880 [Phytophthora fragariae]
MADSPANPPPPASSSGDGAGDAGQQGTPAAPVSPASASATSDTAGSTGASLSASSQVSSALSGVSAGSSGLSAVTTAPPTTSSAVQVSVGVAPATQQPVTVTGLPASMTLSADALQAASTLVRQLQMVPSIGNPRQDSSFLRPASPTTAQTTSASPAVITTTVPATMRDLHRGSTFAGTADGFSRVVPLPRLNDA